MAAIGGKRDGRHFVPMMALRRPRVRRGTVALSLLLVAAGLAGCEYGDQDPVSSPAGIQSGGTVPVDKTASAEEQARQRDLIAEVEGILGPESEDRVVSSLGGMRNAAGTTVMGTMPDRGKYLIRAACSSGPGATLTIRQAGAERLRLAIACGIASETTLELDAGPVTAALEPSHHGLSAGAVRIEVPEVPASTVPGHAG